MSFNVYIFQLLYLVVSNRDRRFFLKKKSTWNIFISLTCFIKHLRNLLPSINLICKYSRTKCFITERITNNYEKMNLFQLHYDRYRDIFRQGFKITVINILPTQISILQIAIPWPNSCFLFQMEVLTLTFTTHMTKNWQFHPTLCALFFQGEHYY